MYKCSIKRQRTTLVLIFSKKTCVIINKCITFVASKNVVLQELHIKSSSPFPYI